jgi:hypothetical protein
MTFAMSLGYPNTNARHFGLLTLGSGSPRVVSADASGG